MDWHLGSELLDRYVTGDLDLARQAAVEAHVLTCADCQALASEQAPQPTLDEIWAGVVTATARPKLPWPLRFLQRLGLTETDAVILRSSTSLYRPWLLSLVGAFVIGVGGSMLSPTEQRAFYLLVAPLLPAITVAAAYDSTDPIRELASATPFSKLRIALLRTALAVAVALPIVLIAGLILPFVGAEAFTWLLPALTLTLLALTLLTWWNAPMTAGVVAALWLLVVGLLRSADQLTAVDTPFAQLAFAVTALLALAVLTIRITTRHAPGGYA
ncbi:putative zinc finger protein [Kribbella sp. VKM Ac-2527]|uniref:Putative zinc finger protein n=1 Tax=Kribbella caucasensis TaxID=2512215 RepID=A0A4R6KHS8_9ACTN|nr:zf-HC2 domain-containing protein [Kribbella sp. VKM Ac-2527]TDO50583.1 putative zinc finger protein [Kribbella sp. VKM Ac-2527]